jgi:CheY-like chemotaxis protein
MIGNGRHRVLVVEDDARVREMVSAHLSRQRYEVVAAESAEKVVDRLRRSELSYDLCLVDLHLPGISGLELSRLLLATAPLKPVILITGDDDGGYAREALAQGVTGYLLKPFQLFELDASLSQAVSMLELVEATETLARAQSATLDDWGEAGGMLPRAWLHLGDERSDAGVGHGARVVSIAGLLAKTLGAALAGHAREVLRTAARTHEIGRLLGAGGPPEVAARSAQLLDNLGFDRAVGEVVRDGVLPWSPGLPLAARVLGLADGLDHDASAHCAAGAEEPAAIRAALDAAVAGAGESTDPQLAAVLDRTRESLESMWVLQRRARVSGVAAT